MPHLIIEYSDNTKAGLNVPALLQEMHQALDGKYNIASNRIKARAVKLTDYIVGDQSADAFMMHITLKLMQGRSVEAQKELSSLLQQIARQHIPANEYPHSAITVEVVELVTATYCP